MNCFNCNLVISSYKEYICHIKTLHKSSCVFICNDCIPYRQFDLFDSFRKHIVKHFKNIEINHYNAPIAPLKVCSEIAKQQPNENILLSNKNITPFSICEKTISNNIKRSNLRLISNLYASNLNKAQIQIVTQQITSYVSNVSLELHEHILNRSKELGESDTNISILRNVLNSISFPLQKLNSDNMRLKFLEENHILLKPTSIKIGEYLNAHRIQNNHILKPIHAKLSYVSIEHILKNFLEQGNILKYIIKYTKDLENTRLIISNIIQTPFFKQKRDSFPIESVLLPLIVYYDDFETNNPLGSSAGFQKLGCIYISLANLPPEFRSKLENIFSVMLFNSIDRRCYGNKVILAPLISELKKLEEFGFSVSVDNQNYQIFVTVVMVVGDNLGMNSILGFSESFSSNSFCRICLSTKLETRTLSKEDPNKLRNVQNYTDQLQSVNHYLYGIKEQCVFNDLANFHCVVNVSVDVMHDIFEGVVKLEIALILYNFIVIKKYLDIESLNFRINNFNYGLNNRVNKPKEMNLDALKHKKIKGSASEMICLLKNLGVMIGDVIPESEELWHLFILLHKLGSIVVCSQIDEYTIQILENLIHEHHSVYIKHFGCTLIPKHHFITHYPRIMQTFGPLVHMWSMRFESNHQVLKKIASNTRSRRNICSTILKRNLLQLSKRKFSNKCLSLPTILGKSVEGYIPEKLTSEMKVLLKNTQCLNQIRAVNYIQYKNVIYRRDMIVILRIDTDSSPIYGQIKSIFSHSILNFFVCLVLDTLYYSDHFCATVVEATNNFEILNVENLLDNQIKNLVKSNSILYVIE